MRRDGGSDGRALVDGAADSTSVGLARGHDPALDGVRAVAVCLVVLTHASFLTGFTTTGGFLGSLAGRGDFGVLLFFVLSGYLLHRQFVVAHVRGATLRTSTYLIRRAARVLPAYWATLAAVALATRPDAWTTGLHALALQIYVPGRQIDSFSQSWSIATEVSFYLALPLLAPVLAALRRRQPSWPLVFLVALSLASIVFVATTGPVDLEHTVVPDRLLVGAAPTFCLGMILAEVAVPTPCPEAPWVATRLHRWASRPAACLLPAGAVYLLATTPMAGSLLLAPAHGPVLAARVCLGAAFAFLVLLPVTLGGPGPVQAALGQGLVRWVGEVSYGIFLWHLPVFMALLSLTGQPAFHGGLAPLLIVGGAITVVLAAASHRIIELPLMRLVARLPRDRD